MVHTWCIYCKSIAKIYYSHRIAIRNEVLKLKIVNKHTNQPKNAQNGKSLSEIACLENRRMR